jgi:phosphatidylglycerol:prolipoprotein diacylglycerol transferase
MDVPAADRASRSSDVLPYLDLRALGLGGAEGAVFWTCVTLAALVGFELVVRRAERNGLDRGATATLAGWMLLGGFVGSHLFAELAYDTAGVASDPARLLWVWGSISSVGGMLGGVATAAGVARARRMTPLDFLRYLDLVGFAAPFAWSFGRLGCALTHDHPGVRSSHWLAVRFPEGPRFDLGLLELFFHVALATAFACLGRVPRRPGTYFGAFLLFYGAVRFFLEPLRIGEPRPGGWTPAQYVCVGGALAGAALLAATTRRASAR